MLDAFLLGGRFLCVVGGFDFLLFRGGGVMGGEAPHLVL